jgi:hypothetical protein
MKKKKNRYDDSTGHQYQNEMMSHHFCWVIIFMTEWLDMPHTLCPDWGSMVSYSTIPAWPTSARLTGSSPAILPTWDQTNNREVINPTPTPPNHGGCDFFSPNVSRHIFTCPWTCENVIWIKIWNLKNWPSKESNPGLPSHIRWSYH